MKLQRIVLVLWRWTSFVAIACLALPFRSPAAEAVEDGPVVFVTIADLHVTDAQSMEEFKQAIGRINNDIKPEFVYIAGDTPDGGTAQQYALYKAVRDTIRCPVYDVVGDHEAKGGGVEHYRKLLGEPTYTLVIGRYRFLGLNSMGLDPGQLEWVRKELLAAKNEKQTPIVLIHHNLAGLKDRAIAAQLDKLLTDGGVKLVLAGHTHNNVVINNGSRLDITTTSIKAPKGKDPRGFAVVTLDRGRLAWHFVPLEQQTIVAICNPLSKLMATGPEAIVKGTVELRVKAYDPTGVRSVVASIGNAESIALKPDAAGMWTGRLDSTSLPEGEQALKVTATNRDGRTASEQIIVLVHQGGAYAAAPATASDAGPGGPAPKGSGKGGDKKAAKPPKQKPGKAKP